MVLSSSAKRIYGSQSILVLNIDKKSIEGRSGSAKKDAGTVDLTECFDILCRFSNGLNIHRTPAMRAR